MFYVIFLSKNDLDPDTLLTVADRSFPDRRAAETYAASVDHSRHPVVVYGPAMPRICDNPHCYFYAHHRCLNTNEGRDEMGHECALYQP